MGRGERRELFVRFGEGRYVYFGTYDCHREDPLLVEEFDQLDWSVEVGSPENGGSHLMLTAFISPVHLLCAQVG